MILEEGVVYRTKRTGPSTVHVLFILTAHVWCAQGSVLGPILFVLYTTPLSESDIIANHQLFADDIQLQKSAPLSEVSNLTKKLSACTDNIKT